MSEWQPIETAPKDGAAVLIYQPADTDNDLPAVIQVARYEATLFEPNIFRWIEAEGEQYETYSPTHWMPLPAPPSES